MFGKTLCVIKFKEFDKGTHFLQKYRKSNTYWPHSDKPPIIFFLLLVYETDLSDFHKLTKTVEIFFMESINLKLFKIEISVTFTMHQIYNRSTVGVSSSKRSAWRIWWFGEFNIHAPVRKKRVGCNQSPFVNRDLSISIMARTCLFNKNKKDNSVGNLFAYKTH